MMNKIFRQNRIFTGVTTEQENCSVRARSAGEKRGDTMIEVMFAVAIFGMLSVLTIGVMSGALGRAEGNLEQTMAREEIEAQAEAIRFIYTAAQDETEADVEDDTYRNVWKTLTSQENSSYDAEGFQEATSCSLSASTTGGMSSDAQGGFALNLNSLDDDSGVLMQGAGDGIQEAETYVIVDDGTSYGLWINVKKNTTDGMTHYDFYIHTCFYAVGSTTATKMDSTVRLMDPGY